MDKIFVLKLAFRNLFSHKLRTLLTLTGIIIGVSAIVFLISFGYGIERLVTKQITNENAFQLIDVGTGNSKVVKLDENLLAKIRDITGVESFETVTNLGGKAKKADGGETMDVAVFGLSSGRYLNWSGKTIRYGEILPDENEGISKVVINSSYAAFLTHEDPQSLIGKNITFDVILPKELSQADKAETFAGQEFQISGVIKDDSSPSVYAKLSKITMTSPLSYSQAKVKVKNNAAISDVRKTIEAYGLKTEFVGDTVSQVQQFFNVFKIVLGSFGLIALGVALLGMFNTLTISLLERVKEVALMKILGMGRGDIQILFLVEAISLGLVGGIIGIMWGILLGEIANFFLNVFAERAGGDPVSVFYFAPGFLLLIVFLSILIGFITGIYPANRAKKVDALDTLRYE